MRAVIVGNSDGIGLALTHRLLDLGWSVVGLSRSPAPVGQHHVVDVTSPDFPAVLAAVGDVDLCVYAAGVGAPMTSQRSEDLTDRQVCALADDLAAQTRTLEVNLLGAARTFEVVAPRMVTAGHGHIIGLSSLADTLISGQAPGYAASKAGLTSYLLGLDAALRPHGVPVTAVRFGFVDTKMAQSPITPFKISREQAVDVLLRCIRTRPSIVSYPRRMAAVTATIGPALRMSSRLRAVGSRIR